MNHIKQLGDMVLASVKDFVERSTQPLAVRIKAIEAWKASVPADLKGERGEKGDPGEPGGVGPAGRDGVDGKDGRDGIDGAKGDPGERGEAGQPGRDGVDGKNGADGINGKDGAPGEKGEPGLNGKDADPEVIAAMVADGIAKALPDAVRKEIDALMPELVAKAAAMVPTPKDGADGKPGADGRDGIDGKSVDAAEVEALVAKHVAALPVPKDGRDGVDGQPGRDGIDGKGVDIADVEALVAKQVAMIPTPKDGRDGQDGKDVDPEVIAGMVQRAVDAIPRPRDGKDYEPEVLRAAVQEAVAQIPVPKDGRDGVDGKDGRDGRDAMEIEVRRGLDSLRRYHPGEHVAFRGGVIRSFRQTDPLGDDGNLEDAGWHVITNGIAEVAAELSEDARTVGVAIKMTNGEVITRTAAIPTTIYRGIWRDGEVYTKGDQATRDGSTWTLLLPEQKGKPGDDNSGWQLSAKRGNHGRDGLRGEKGERGAEGRAGRDLTQMSQDGSRY